MVSKIELGNNFQVNLVSWGINWSRRVPIVFKRIEGDWEYSNVRILFSNELKKPNDVFGKFFFDM